MDHELVKLLAAARPAEFRPGTAVAPATRERELAAAFTIVGARGTGRHGSERPARFRAGGFRGGGFRGGGFRAGWRGAGLAVGAAAAVIAVIATLVGQAPVRSPAASAPMSAQRILLAAARSAAGVRATAGEYWLTDEVTGTTYLMSGAGGRYLINDATEEKTWYANTPNRPVAAIKAGRIRSVSQYWAGRDLGAHPVGAASMAAWRRSGAPAHWLVPGAHGLVTVNSHPTEWTIYEEQTAFPTAFPDGSLQRLRHLPATAAGLRAYLLTANRTCSHGCVSGLPVPELLFNEVVNLEDEPVSPPVRAAAYRMIAQLPGVRAVGWVTDPLGRRGYAVALAAEQLVLQPATGQLLAEELIHHAHGPAAPGQQIMSWTASKQAAWTDAEPSHADFIFNGVRMIPVNRGHSG